MKRIAIESEMDHAVAALGGMRVDGIESVGKAPDFLNADYLFEAEDITVELKAMDGDSWGKSVEWIVGLFQEWVERGILPPPSSERVKYSLQDVPFEEAVRAYRKVRATVMDNIKKANNQIKSTREHLGRPNAKGVLLLANDGNTFLELEVALFVLARIFGKEGERNKHYTGIDRVVYFTANMPGVVPGVGKHTQVWINLNFGGHAAELTPFLVRLSQAWIARVEQVMGQPIPVFKIRETDIKQVRFRDPSVPFNDPVNPLLVENFEFYEGTEQSMIDALTTLVPILRGADRDTLEVIRTLVDVESSPSTWFPAFVRVCRAFGLFAVYMTCDVENWPGRMLLSVSISKVADLSEEGKERLLHQNVFPMGAEAVLIESLPVKFEELRDCAEVELCWWKLSEGAMVDPYQEIICVAQLCREHDVVLLAEGMMRNGVAGVSVKMRRSYVQLVN